MHSHIVSLLLTVFFGINLTLAVILHMVTRLQFPNPPSRMEVLVYFLAFAIFGLPLTVGAMVWHLSRAPRRQRESMD
jgi:hypothetical protein